MRSTRLQFRRERDLPLYALILPAFLVLLLFHYLPLYGLVISFQDFNPFRGVLDSAWVGLKHYRCFLLDENLWRVMRNTVAIILLVLRSLANTVIVTVVATALSLVVNTMAAYAFSKTFYGKKLVTYLFVITMYFSGGLIPTYLVVTKYLHLYNTHLAFFLPSPMSSISSSSAARSRRSRRA